MGNKIVLCLCFVFMPFYVLAQTKTGRISGKVTILDNKSIEKGYVFLINTNFQSNINTQGEYYFENVPFGSYTLVAFASGKKTYEKDITLYTEDIRLDAIYLQDFETELESVTIQAQREKTFGITRLKSVENFGIYEAKKNEVIVLDDINANLSTNNARQIYARITGLNIWESDQAGLQLGIGGRGLSPNRTANFNTRQNGYDISADALGYPEAYYTPPTEALDKIEIIRGASSLQYGTQFGGMLNFRFKKGNPDRKLEFITRQSIGSWGFLGTFNSFGGKIGKVQYYSYYQYRKGEGYRPNSNFDYHNGFIGLDYQITKDFLVNIEITKMQYLAKQAGGLTDRNFQENSRQSLRNRNWFKADWNLFALNFTWKLSENTQLNMRNFALIASRSSVGNLERINVADFGGNRTLIDGQFQNFGNEIRLLHKYSLGNQNPKNTLLVGSRIYQGTTTATQGEGTAGNDANFSYLNPNDVENSDYKFPNQNYAFFIENIFNISQKISITPGVRFENIQTYAKGYYKQYLKDGAGNIIEENKFEENKARTRNFLLFGLGISYKYSDKTEFYGNISQNYRAINFSDLRIVNQNFRIDPNIQDEKGFTADFGIRGDLEEVFTYELTAFYLAYKGKIGQVLRTDSVLFNDFRFRTNVSDARNVGVEAFGEISLSKLFGGKNKNLKSSIFANFSYIDARYINTQDNTIRNKQVEMVPPITLKLGKNFSYKNFNTSLQFSYIKEHFSDASNSQRTATAIEGIIPSYKVMDLSVRYTWRFLTLEGTVNNLLDEKYFTRRAEAYPGPGIIPADGRGFYLTLQGKF